MQLEEIDRWCDRYEQRRRSGDALTVEAFLTAEGLPQDSALLAELRRVEREFAPQPTEVHAAPDPGAAAHQPTQGMPPTDSRSQWIGPFKLLQPLGEGGMGVVYLAEQTRPVARRVALKIIKPGMDSRQVIARFEAERQALALMDHPNIAQVFDAGTTDDGRPYFVMELVKGIPITKYCDEKQLTPRERLQLMVPICQAVQHAHQKGVIHRDLKPSNVLVTEVDGRPVPKIIDFGLAKAVSQRLTDQTVFTQFGQIVGTIDYMSPEQASFSALDVDTRTDIYSLGVMLYELLTGDTPFDKKRMHQAALDELLRIIRQEEPPRPSTRLSSHASLPSIAASRKTDPRKLSVLVRGELDWIVMKALEKDRNRRYETANGLALDVQRYLADEPVSACPPSATYRLRKLARRHKAAAVTVSAVAIALLLGLVGTSWQAIRATNAESDLITQRDRANDQTAKALENLGRAEQAEEDLTAQLWQSYLSEAQARRWSGRPGRRFESLEAIRKAAEIRPSLELRNEAIACMALLDVRFAKTWDGFPHDPALGATIFFDSDVQLYSRTDSDGSSSIRRVVDDQEIVFLPGPGLASQCQGFSPDRRFLISNSHHAVGPSDRHTVLWRIPEGEKVFEMTNQMLNRAAEFSPDSRVVAIGQADRAIHLYSTEDGTEVGRIELELTPYTIHFDETGGRIAAVGYSDRRLEIRDTASGAQLAIVAIPSAAPVMDFAWHPDGRQLAVGAGANLVLCSSVPGRIERTVEAHPNSVIDHLAYSRAGDVIATVAWSGAGALWDSSRGERIISIAQIVQNGWGPRFEFGPDDRLLAYDLRRPEVRLWELNKGMECLQLYGTGHRSAAIHPDGRIAAVTDDQGMRLWDLATSRELGYVAQCTNAQFHPDGDAMVIVRASRLERWPLQISDDEASIHVQLGPPERLREQSVRSGSLSLSVDGSRIIAVDPDGYCAMIDWDEPSQVQRFGPQPNMMHASLSPEQQWIATGTWYGNDIKVWNRQTGEVAFQAPGTIGSAIVEFSPDGRWLATSEQNALCIWNTSDWTLEHQFEAATTDNVLSPLAFSPDSRMLVIRSDAIARLIDVATWSEIATLTPPDPRTFEGLAFSRDGSRLAVSAMGLLQVWDLRTIRKELAVMGLDWDLPEYAPDSSAASHVPLEMSVLTEPVGGNSAPPSRIAGTEIVRRLAQVTSMPLTYVSLAFGRPEIMLADPELPEPVNLSQDAGWDSSPAWSPDGRQLAYETSQSGNFDLYVINADGSSRRELRNSPVDERCPTWSADGVQICYVNVTGIPDQGWELFAVDVSTGDERNLTNHSTSEGDPAWSPRGDKIAFGSNRDDSYWKLLSMDPDGSNVQILSRSSTGGYVYPAWSPDGHRIAFTGFGNGSQEIFVIDADGRNERQLTRLGGLTALAAWSPDGRHIAFLHRPVGSPQGIASLYVMQADGTEVTEIAPLECPLDGGRPAWKPLASSADGTSGE